LKESVAELSKQLIGVQATLNELAEKENPSNLQCKFSLPLSSVEEVEDLEERLDQKAKVAMVCVPVMATCVYNYEVIYVFIVIAQFNL